MRNLALSIGCLVLSSTCLAQTTNWVQVKTKSSPPARWGHGTAYDVVSPLTSGRSWMIQPIATS